MKMNFSCKDPLATASRVLDTARRLSLTLEAFSFERKEDGFETSITLAHDPSNASPTFAARIGLLLDLEMDVTDV